jgi:hypothetical protein
MSNILFFSNFDSQSKSFISLLQNEGLLNFFTCICKDGNPNFPKEVMYLPTIIINNANGKQQFVGPEAFGWLQRIKQLKASLVMKQMQNLTQTQVNSLMGNLNMKQTFIDYSKLEMEGTSDTFTYTADNGDNVPHSFVSPKANTDIFTTPDVKEKLNPKDQKKLCDDLMKNRQIQDQQIKKTIDSLNDTLKKIK